MTEQHTVNLDTGLVEAAALSVPSSEAQSQTAPAITLPAAEQRAVIRSLWLLPRRNPTRLAAETVLAGEPLSAAARQSLLHRLRQYSLLRWREQELAAWALGAAAQSPAERQEAAFALIEVLAARWRGGRYTGWILLLASTVVALASPLFGTISLWHMFLAWIGCWIVMSPIVYFGMLPGSYLCHRVRASAVSALGRLGCVEAVGPVAQALFATDTMPGYERVQGAATTALPGVLAGLTPAHYGSIDAGTIVNLVRMLSRKDESLVLSALEALGKVGDGRVLSAVERASRRGRTERIRATAERILPVVRERMASDPQWLLRASSASGEDAEGLLRPAGGGEAADLEVLVRPVEGDT